MTERIDSRFHDGNGVQVLLPGERQWISFGWVGGLMNTFPMLALGDETAPASASPRPSTSPSRAPRAKPATSYGAIEPRRQSVRPRRLPTSIPNRAHAPERRRAVLDDQAVPCCSRRRAAPPPSSPHGNSPSNGSPTPSWPPGRRDGQWGNYREPRDRRRRRLQHHQRRHGHRRAGPGVGLFRRTRVTWRSPRRPPTTTTSATSSDRASPPAPAPTSCRTPTPKPPPAS